MKIAALTASSLVLSAGFILIDKLVKKAKTQRQKVDCKFVIENSGKLMMTDVLLTCGVVALSYMYIRGWCGEAALICTPAAGFYLWRFAVTNNLITRLMYIMLPVCLLGYAVSGAYSFLSAIVPLLITDVYTSPVKKRYRKFWHWLKAGCCRKTKNYVQPKNY